MSTFTVLNPATEEPVTTLTQASAADADEAIARASAALPSWRAVSPGDRARMLREVAYQHTLPDPFFYLCAGQGGRVARR